MQFQSMSALWWLLPVAGTIIVLYLLRMRRQDVKVPAVFLWPQLTADVRANAPLQKLRWSWLLLLQLLVAGLLVAGLAGPLHRERGLRGKTTVFVLDASASMGATDARPTRYEAARRQIEAAIGTLAAGDRCALVEAGAQTRVLSPLTADKPKLRDALRRGHVTDAPGEMGEALRLASALVGQQAQGRIVVFSDGAFPAVRDFSPGRADLVFAKVGTGGRNLAVTALEAGPTPGGGTQLFAAVHNEDTHALKTVATFTVDGVVTDVRSIAVGAGQTIGQTLPLPASARRAEVHLATPGDLLPADDTASVFVQGAGAVRVLLVSQGDLFLERALALEPSVKLDRAASVPLGERAEASGDGSYDLVIFDDTPPQAVKAQAVWSLGGAGAGLPVVDAGASVRPQVLSWKRDDPVLRDASLQDILIEQARRVRAAPDARILAQGTDGPLMVASQRGGHRALYVGWSLLQSDFPLRAAFPIFVDNALSWLTNAGAETASGGINVRAGQPFTLAVPRPGSALTLTSATGERTSLDTSSGIATVRGADRVGVDTIAGPGFRKDAAVSLLSDTESDIRPRTALSLSGRSVAAQGRLLSLAELWRPLVLAALAVLSLEWWLFARRS